MQQYNISYTFNGRKKSFRKVFKTEQLLKGYLKAKEDKGAKLLKYSRVGSHTPNRNLEFEILSKKRVLVEVNYIYALINENKVVYIGSTSDIMSRLGTHIKGEKEFTHYAIVETSPSKEYVLKKEAEYIKELRPLYNSTFKKTRKL